MKQYDSIVQTVESPVDIVNLLNRYFYSVFSRDDFIPISSEEHSNLLEIISDITLTEAEVNSVLP